MSDTFKKLKAPTSKKGNWIKVIGGLLCTGAGVAAGNPELVGDSAVVSWVEVITGLFGIITFVIGQLKTKDPIKQD